MKANKSKEKVEVRPWYTNSSRLKWSSKKKSAKMFSTKDSNELQGHTDSKNSLRGGWRDGEERRSTSSIGFYASEKGLNPQSSYNRYINQYTSYIAASNPSLKAKGNHSMIKRKLKSRGAKNICISSIYKDNFNA